MTSRAEFRDALIEELRFLRASPGPPHPFNMNECPCLCRAMGIEEAFIAAREVREDLTFYIKDKSSPKLSNIAVASLVIMAEGDNALQKRELVASQIFKDERTVRRMSDKGCIDLADMFLEIAAIHGWLDHQPPDEV
jgi:hypothetical protein